MSKVIVERPRRRGWDGSSKRAGRRIDPDLQVSKEGMRAPHIRHYGGKELNENLAPLRRFIQSCVGRPWNDVYSEISQHLRVDSAVQQHVRDHVEDFVAVRTRFIDGEIWVTSRWGYPHLLKGSWDEFYVDPRDGVLRRNENRETYTQRWRREGLQKKLEDAAKVHVNNDGTEYRKLGGIWYRVLWDTVPPSCVTKHTDPVTGKVTERYHESTKTDVFTGKRHSSNGEIYRSGKKQASREELKRNDLKNDI